MCMIANEIQRDEEVSADVTTKDPAPGYAQGLQSSTGEGSLAVDEHGPHEEVVKTTVLKYAAEHRARAVPLSPEGKQGDSSVVVDKKRVAAAAVGEGAPCTSKKATPSKQRIQVIVRIRPIHPGAARTTALFPDGKTLCLHTTPTKGEKEQLDQGRLRESRKELRVTFDRILGEEAKQEEVYEQVRACVRLPFLGVNACVLAYGQTGSGKTFTMIGGGSRCRQTLAGPPPRTTSIADPSSGEIDRSAKEQPVAGVRPSSGKDRDSRSCHSATPSSSAGEAGRKYVPTALDERGGVIPRAVSDIFKFVREGLGTSAADCGGGRSAHLQGSKSAEEVDYRASTAASRGGNCTMDSGSSGCSTTSNNSGRSSCSEDFETDCHPSATQWLWRKQNGPVRDQNEDPGAREHILPFSYLEGEVRALGNEGGRRHERDKRSAAQSMRGGSTVECSYMQVYNGFVYDLLSRDNSMNRTPLPTTDSAKRPDTSHVNRAAATASESASRGMVGVDTEQTDVVGSERTGDIAMGRRMGGRISSHGGDISVIGLSLHTVDTAEQAMELLRRGSRNRQVRSTQMNVNSSRSHSIVQFTITNTRRAAATSCRSTVGNEHSEPTEPGGDNDNKVTFAGSAAGGTGDHVTGDCCTPDEGTVTTRAKLSLVDLAGSEKGGGRGVEGRPPPPSEDGEQERERSKINISLSALSNCISGLGEESRTHVPFRDNPLTRLLQSSLVGGKTVVIATINPSIDAKVESISTLNFAARCMRVAVRPRVNEVASDALLLQRAKREIFALRRRLREIETAASSRQTPLGMMTVPRRPGAGPPLEAREKSDAVNTSESLLNAEAKELPVSAGHQVGLVGDSRCSTQILPTKGAGGQKKPNSERLSSDTSAIESNYWGNLRRDSGRGDARTTVVETDARQRQGRRPQSTAESSARRNGRGGSAPDESRGRDITALKRTAAPPPATPIPRRRASDGMVRTPIIGAASLTKKRHVLLPVPSSDPTLVTRRRQKMGAATGSDDQGNLATVALMERFSYREGELLRELETWKKRCKKHRDTETRRDTACTACTAAATQEEPAASNRPKRLPRESGEDITKEKAISGVSACSAPPSPMSLSSDKQGTVRRSNVRGKQNSSPNAPITADSDSNTPRSGVTRTGRCESDQQGSLGAQKGGPGVAGTNCTGSGGDVWASVLFDLVGEREDDMDLKRGDRIKVIRRRLDGWWYGRSSNTGIAGLFPSNYVELLVDTDHQHEGAATSSEGVRTPRSDQNGSLPVVDSSKVYGDGVMDGVGVFSPGRVREGGGGGAGGAGEGVSSRHCENDVPSGEDRMCTRVKVECRGCGSLEGESRECHTPQREIEDGFRGNKEDLKTPINNRTGTSSPEPPPTHIRHEGSGTDCGHEGFQTQHERAYSVGLRLPSESRAASRGSEATSEQIFPVGRRAQACRERVGLEESKPRQADDFGEAVVGGYRHGSTTIGHPAPLPESTSGGVFLSDARCKERDHGGDENGMCRQHGLSGCILCTFHVRAPAAGDELSTTSLETPGGKDPTRHAPITAGLNDGSIVVGALPLTKLSHIGMVPSATGTGLFGQGELDVFQGQQHPGAHTGNAGAGEGGERRTTCERHLLEDCILCKMWQGGSSKSASLSATGHAQGNAGAGSTSCDTPAGAQTPRTATLILAATGTASVADVTPLPLSGIPRQPKDGHGCCDRHGLLGCLLCADRDANIHTVVRGSDPHSFLHRTRAGNAAESQPFFAAASLSYGTKRHTHASLLHPRTNAAIESSPRGNGTGNDSPNDVKRATDEIPQLLPVSTSSGSRITNSTGTGEPDVVVGLVAPPTTHGESLPLDAVVQHNVHGAYDGTHTVWNRFRNDALQPSFLPSHQRSRPRRKTAHNSDEARSTHTHVDGSNEALGKRTKNRAGSTGRKDAGRNRCTAVVAVSTRERRHRSRDRGAFRRRTLRSLDSAVRQRGHADTASSRARLLERTAGGGNGDDLAARAITAALAVL